MNVLALVGLIASLAGLQPQPTPSLFWVHPDVTPVGQSTGYTQFCDTFGVTGLVSPPENVTNFAVPSGYAGQTICGSYPAIFAFTNGSLWKSTDDDNSGWTVRFRQPTLIAGIRFYTWQSVSTGPDPARTYRVTFTFRDTDDITWPDPLPTDPEPFYVAVDPAVPDSTYTLETFMLPSPVVVSNLRMDYLGDSWGIMGNGFEILTSAPQS